jgi:hypothetical protein
MSGREECCSLSKKRRKVKEADEAVVAMVLLSPLSETGPSTPFASKKNHHLHRPYDDREPQNQQLDKSVLFIFVGPIAAVGPWPSSFLFPGLLLPPAASAAACRTYTTSPTTTSNDDMTTRSSRPRSSRRGLFFDRHNVMAVPIVAPAAAAAATPKQQQLVVPPQERVNGLLAQ